MQTICHVRSFKRKSQYKSVLPMDDSTREIRQHPANGIFSFDFGTKFALTRKHRGLFKPWIPSGINQQHVDGVLNPVSNYRRDQISASGEINAGKNAPSITVLMKPVPPCRKRT